MPDRTPTQRLVAAGFLVALVGLVLTAGCLGAGDSTSTETSPSSSPASNPTAAEPANASEPEANASQPEPTTHWINRTGQVTGVSIVIGNLDGPTNETISVPEAARDLALTVRAEGGELDVQILPPGCTDGDDVLTLDVSSPDCATYGETTNGTTEQVAPDGGTVTFAEERPKAGNWTVNMDKEDAGNTPVPYHLQAVYVAVPEPAGGG